MIRANGFGAAFQAFDALEEAMTPEVHGYSIGTNVRYAPFQEFGTSYQSGKAHLRPAFDQVVAIELQSITATSDDAGVILKKAALEIERLTKIRAPVDTGNLRDSYRAEEF